MHAASRADARYCARVNPAGSSVIPSCSIPTERALIFPVARVPGDVALVNETILPRRETT